MLNLQTASREELVKEIERLRVLENSVASIEELHAVPGEMEARIKLHPHLKTYMLQLFAELLMDAPNYTESKFDLAGHKPNGEAAWVTVTVLKSTGKTPHQLRQEAEEKLAHAKIELEDYRNALKSIAGQHEVSNLSLLALGVLQRHEK